MSDLENHVALSAERSRDSLSSSSLIERLENATGPDESLDCRIREAIEGWKNIGGGWREWSDGRRERYDFGFAPPYTSSIDAALTLVPEGGFPRIARIAPDLWEAHIGFANRAVGTLAQDTTPAIALCIAALKAREATGAAS